MTSSQELGKYIAAAINRADSIESNQVKQDTLSSYFILNNWGIKVKATRLLVETRTLGDSFVLGLSRLGTGRLGSSTAGSWTEVESNYQEYPIPQSYKNELAKWFNGDSADYPSHIEIGTGSTAYNESQTALVSASGDRVAIIASTSSKKVTYTATLTARTDSNIREIGLFNASSSGDMAIRYIIADLDMVNTSQYRITIDLELEDASIGSALVVDEGLNEIRDWLNDGTGTAPTYTEWNDATGTPATTDTAADWDAGGSNEQRNIFGSTSILNNVVSYTTILTAAQLSGVDITKTGTFNAAANGNLFGQNLYGVVNKTTLFQVFETDSYTFR